MQLRFLWGYRPKLVFTKFKHGEFEFIVTSEDEVPLGYQPKLVFTYGKVTLYISTCEADVPLSSVTHC